MNYGLSYVRHLKKDSMIPRTSLVTRAPKILIGLVYVEGPIGLPWGPESVAALLIAFAMGYIAVWINGALILVTSNKDF